MNRLNIFNRCFFLVLLISSLVGCLPVSQSEAPFLLGQNYTKMNDAELIAYEQALSDELVKESRSGHSDVNVGIGLGSWGSHIGYGVQTNQRLWDGTNTTAEELKVRRDEVRSAMKERGLLQK